MLTNNGIRKEVPTDSLSTTEGVVTTSSERTAFLEDLFREPTPPSFLQK